MDDNMMRLLAQLIVNPRANVPLQEQFEELRQLVPRGSKYNVRPLGHGRREEIDAHESEQKNFDTNLLPILKGMPRDRLENLGLQIFNVEPREEWQGPDVLRQMDDDSLRGAIYKRLILTAPYAGS